MKYNTIDENGLKQGFWEEVGVDINKKWCGYYENSKKEGVWTLYNGYRLTIKCNYENDEVNGDYFVYGDVDISKYRYKDGLREGVFESRDRLSNRLITRGFYKNHSMFGVWKYYDKKGKLSVKENYLYTYIHKSSVRYAELYIEYCNSHSIGYDNCLHYEEYL